MGTQVTVRVRIAVAVTDEGNYCAIGKYHRSRKHDASVAVASVEKGKSYHVVWVTAQVPLPTQETVEGRVEA